MDEHLIKKVSQRNVIIWMKESTGKVLGNDIEIIEKVVVF